MKLVLSLAGLLILAACSGGAGTGTVSDRSSAGAATTSTEDTASRKLYISPNTGRVWPPQPSRSDR
jgi:hypothetical protein